MDGRVGVDFARLPMDYRCWTGDDWLDFDEGILEEIDEAAEYGEKCDSHVDPNFHRGPGFTVADSPEEADLAAEFYPDAERRAELSGTESLISIEKARDLLGWEPGRSWRDL